jgi:hypothetical protein
MRKELLHKFMGALMAEEEIVLAFRAEYSIYIFCISTFHLKGKSIFESAIVFVGSLQSVARIAVLGNIRVRHSDFFWCRFSAHFVISFLHIAFSVVRVHERDCSSFLASNFVASHAGKFVSNFFDVLSLWLTWIAPSLLGRSR